LNWYAADRAPTEAELQAIARAAYEKLLSELCQDQRSTPHHAEFRSVTNLTFADYFQRLNNNGGTPRYCRQSKAFKGFGYPSIGD